MPTLTEVLHSLLIDLSISSIPFEKWCEACEHDRSLEWVMHSYTECIYTEDKIYKILTGEQIYNLVRLCKGY